MWLNVFKRLHSLVVIYPYIQVHLKSLFLLYSPLSADLCTALENTQFAVYVSKLCLKDEIGFVQWLFSHLLAGHVTFGSCLTV